WTDKDWTTPASDHKVNGAGFNVRHDPHRDVQCSSDLDMIAFAEREKLGLEGFRAVCIEGVRGRVEFYVYCHVDECGVARNIAHVAAPNNVAPFARGDELVALQEALAELFQGLEIRLRRGCITL